MFERFTDRARRVVVLAQEEARLLNHNYIGTEHILLGLIHEGEGVAATRDHRGAFSSGFDKGFDISRLEVQRTDGSTVFFDVELDTVTRFWEDFFEKYLED